MLDNTHILKSNEWINVKNINIGDTVQGVKGEVKVVKVGKTFTRTLVKLNDEIITTTLQGFIDADNHILFLNQRYDMDYNENKYIAVKESLLIYFDGTLRQPEKIEFIDLQEPEEVYYIVTEDGSFYANGYAVASWEPCKIETYLKDIKL